MLVKQVDQYFSRKKAFMFAISTAGNYGTVRTGYGTNRADPWNMTFRDSTIIYQD